MYSSLLQTEKDALEQELTTLKGHKKYYKEKLDRLMDTIKTTVDQHETINKEYEVRYTLILDSG